MTPLEVAQDALERAVAVRPEDSRRVEYAKAAALVSIAESLDALVAGLNAGDFTVRRLDT